MATHSCAYIPTNRKPGEYIMSEGWSDGMLDSTGLQWYQSAPRMVDAIRATLMLGGSPAFAPAGDTALDIKEIDYLQEDIREAVDCKEDAAYNNDEDFIAGVAITIDALMQGDWTLAESTTYGKMTLEEQMEMGITLNTSIHEISDFSTLPVEYGMEQPALAYDAAVLVDALNVALENDKELDVHAWYFYHNEYQQWWGTISLPGNRCMYVPLVTAFAIKGDTPFEEVKALHGQYPNDYAKDITDLAVFEAARQT